MKGKTYIEEIPYNQLKLYGVKFLNELSDRCFREMHKIARSPEGSYTSNPLWRRIDKEQDLIIAIVDLKKSQKSLKKVLKEQNHESK